MIGPFEMVLGIVALTTIAGIWRAKHGIRRDKEGNEYAVDRGAPDTDRLRDEVKTLKERIAVLERIATDRENSLDREIERLRDR